MINLADGFPHGLENEVFIAAPVFHLQEPLVLRVDHASDPVLAFSHASGGTDPNALAEFLFTPVFETFAQIVRALRPAFMGFVGSICTNEKMGFKTQVGTSARPV